VNPNERARIGKKIQPEPGWTFLIWWAGGN
jgi:hypothetical protein